MPAIVTDLAIAGALAVVVLVVVLAVVTWLPSSL